MHLVFFTGAGISAESGIRTFRDSDGLWEEYDVMDVATPEAWSKDRELVLRFYNDRRKQIMEASPNKAHRTIVDLEKHFSVSVITQNIDDLHERAGSSDVLHLHGEIMLSRSTVDHELLYPVTEGTIQLGDKCEKGSQLRPHVVWFGEAVPAMEPAYALTHDADIFIVVGSSLNVYPAAGLAQMVRSNTPIYVVDPKDVPLPDGATHIMEKAGKGLPILAEKLMAAR